MGAPVLFGLSADPTVAASPVGRLQRYLCKGIFAYMTASGRTEDGNAPGRAEARDRSGRAEAGGAPVRGDTGDAPAPQAPRTVTRLTDPRALRAYAHPIRLSLVGLLRREGPLTATRAGELLGESSGTCSYHLRQLARYGLVAEAGGGTGREKPWRATTMFTGWPDVADTPELAAAAGQLRTVLAERYFGQLMRWLEARPDEPPEWQRAAHFGDTSLYVTADELTELDGKVREVLDVYLDRQVSPELRPPGARRVTYLHLAFPGDLSGARDESGR
jgi:Helix-turn-helix domain